MKNNAFYRLAPLLLSLTLFSTSVSASETEAGNVTGSTAYSSDISASPSENALYEDISSRPMGYRSIDPDRTIPMPDRDITYSEILDEIVDYEGKTDATDYSPRASLPSRYPASQGSDEDMKNYINGKYPSLKNQGDFGTCWAFSSVDAAEFYMINRLGFDSTVDLSEEYLAYGIYRDREYSAAGSDSIYGNVSYTGSDKDMLSLGSDYLLACQYLSKGAGFINEADFPYIGNEDDSAFDGSGNLNKDTASLRKNRVSLLTDGYAVNLKSATCRSIVKEAVMRNGIVATRFFAGDENHPKSRYLNNEKTAYYNNEVPNSNHGVGIVGWNDEFPSTSFANDRQPSSNGAWLIRNSWYRPSDDFYSFNNYFWISYEDKSLDAAIILDVKKAPAGYDNNYYYDTRIHNIRYLKGNLKTSNVFTVGNGSNEYLTSVGLETPEPLNYEINIYTDLKDKNNPESGTLSSSATTKGTLNLQGVYTIPLNSPVLLEAGSDFSVVVKTGSYSPVIEMSFPEWSDIGLTIECGAKRGQSFIYENSAWTDWTEHSEFSDGCGNFCISAMTSYTDEEVPVTEEVVFKDTYGQNVILLHNKEDNTYKTSDGKDVLVFSTETGESIPAPQYQFTGKKMYPAKKSFVVYKGTLYKYKTDYSIKYKKNKNRGSAVVTVKWKKTSAPYKAGEKKAVMSFNIVARTVSDNMVSFKLKNNKLKSLRVQADGITMKPKKKDYDYKVYQSGECQITFKNDYSGAVNIKG